MPKNSIQSPMLPRPINPIAQATMAAGFVYTAGQLGRGADGKPLNGMEAQARQVMENLKAIMEEAGGNLRDILRCEVHVVDLSEMPVFNAVWTEYFAEEPPARCAAQVAGLVPGYRVEVTAVAYVGRRS